MCLSVVRVVLEMRVKRNVFVCGESFARDESEEKRVCLCSSLAGGESEEKNFIVYDDSLARGEREEKCVCQSVL